MPCHSTIEMRDSSSLCCHLQRQYQNLGDGFEIFFFGVLGGGGGGPGGSANSITQRLSKCGRMSFAEDGVWETRLSLR